MVVLIRCKYVLVNNLPIVSSEILNGANHGQNIYQYIVYIQICIFVLKYWISVVNLSSIYIFITFYW